MIDGCIFLSKNGLAAYIISPAKTITLVVPSPTSSSYALDISNILLAAGCLTSISLRMACPSLDNTIPPIGSINIFNIDLGPKVLTTISAIA